jgi:hypothetical protein
MLFFKELEKNSLCRLSNNQGISVEIIVLTDLQVIEHWKNSLGGKFKMRQFQFKTFLQLLLNSITLFEIRPIENSINTHLASK